jgi:uncharacterized protein
MGILEIPMNLSDGEKLILVMLSEIYKHLKINHEINPDLVMSSIFSNQTWGLKWEYGELFNSPGENPPVVEETCNILNMYRALTPSFERLSPADQKRVIDESKPFDDYIKFQGFDFNNDPHAGVLSYLVKDLKRYDELNGVALNSHSALTLRTYRAMLKNYQPMIESYSTVGLNSDQIIQILKIR